MATLWIREYSQIGVAAEKVQIAQEPGADQSPVSFVASTQSAAFGTNTKYITIIANAAFHYAVGANPTATVNMIYVPAGTLYSIGVTPGQKIAAVAAA